MSDAAETPLALRAIAVDGVWWTVVAQERRLAFAREMSLATYAWFTRGQATRVAYVTRAAREVLEWPERELRELFDQAVLATAG